MLLSGDRLRVHGRRREGGLPPGPPGAAGEGRGEETGDSPRRAGVARRAEEAKGTVGPCCYVQVQFLITQLIISTHFDVSTAVTVT